MDGGASEDSHTPLKLGMIGVTLLRFPIISLGMGHPPPPTKTKTKTTKTKGKTKTTDHVPTLMTSLTYLANIRQLYLNDYTCNLIG